MMTPINLQDPLTDEQIKRLNKFAKSLADDQTTLDALRTKTNAEIAELLLERVWAHQLIHSFESLLVETAFERLKGSK